MARMRQGGGFGFVILLVVMAVVLYLATRNWKAVLPGAVGVTRQAQGAKQQPPSADVPPPAVNSGAGQRQIQSSLSEAKKQTNAHTGQLAGALEQ